MMDDLRAKYDEVAGNFDAFLKEAEDNSDELEKDLDRLRERIESRQDENDTLRRQVDDNEHEIQILGDDITALSGDLEKLKSTHESSIRTLETERTRNEKIIADLTKKAADTEHEFQKTQILIEKQKTEIDFINKEQEKFRSQSYAEKVEKFKDYIEDSNRKTKQMQDDLNALKREWD